MPAKPPNGIQPPRLPKTLDSLESLKLPLPDKTSFAHVKLVALDLSGQNADRVHFEETQCEQVNATETRLDHLRQEDARWVGCNLANATWSQTMCARVEFSGCRMTGFAALEATFHDVLFKECKGDLARWYGATFRAARFDHCILAGADFRSADLTGVVFAYCDLTNTDFTGAKLVGADLRGCPIAGVRIGPAELRGATIDEAQALALVRGMGITIG